MLPHIELKHEYLKLIAEVDSFKGQWSATQVLAPERLLALRKVATIESIGSSTRIEGVKLSDQEVEKLLKGLKSFSFRSRDEQEVAGYAEAMDLVFNNYLDISLNENHMKQLHAIVLKYSTKDERHRGEYKKFPNNVEAFNDSGQSIGIIFATTSPFNTPKEMKSLFEWVNQAFEKNEFHPLLIVALFIVYFLAIHPFQDGNGRLSRILTTLLLLQQNYLYVPYSSLERIIEANKEDYYLALRQSQSTINSPKEDLSSWILFFLQCLVKQKRELEKKIASEKLIENLPELSLQILVLIKQHGRASVADIVTITAKNRSTIKSHLKRLVQEKKIVQNGQGKGTWYSLL